MARVVVNRKVVEELLKKTSVPLLEEKGNAIRDAAGAEDFETEVWEGANRARVTVRTATFRGRYREAKYRTLSRAIEAGRG